MLKDTVAVIDVGSSKISGIIGENGVNNNYVIRAHCEFPTFALGGAVGEIDAPEEFTKSIKNVLSSMENSARAKITKVYFGVPGDFLAIRNSSLQMYLNKPRKLKQKDVDEYLLSARKPLAVQGYELVAESGVSYRLDGQQRTTSLTGKVTSSINGLTTFYFAKQAFVRSVRDALTGAGVKDVRFVPVPLAESLMLFDENERFSFQLIVDVGSSVTNFSVVYGDGVLYNASFACGGGYISGYLMQRLNLPTYDLAERIKRKLNLTIPLGYNGVYEVTDGDSMYKFSQRSCNEVAEYVLSDLAEKIDGAIKDSNVRLPGGLNISLTGGGVAYVRGAREYLFNAVEIPVNIVCPKVGYMAKPEETSKMAVLNYALNFKGV